MGPYEALATSGRFNLYVAAPERTLAPLFPGDLSIVPHYSFEEYDAAYGGAVDLVVVPYIPNTATADAAVVSWIRAKADAGTTILSVCAGALAVAEAGVLEGKTATTHHFSMLAAERQFPGVQWVRGRRYVDAGQFISSQGVTSGIDATLYTLGRMFGRETAEQTAQAMGYPHIRFLDDPTSDIRASGDLAVLENFYRWDRSEIGLLLYDGVRELEIASVIDVYPRSVAATIRTLAPQRTVIRSRHGLDLVPNAEFSTAPSLDRVLLPGNGQAPAAVAAVQAWTARRTSPAVEPIHANGSFLYDLTLGDLARSQSNAVARAAANVLEYPTRDLVLDGPAWQYDLLARPLALGVLGLGVALWLRHRAARHGSVLPRRLRGAVVSGGHFTLHFAEMSLAMGAGMVVFHVLVDGHGLPVTAEASSAAFRFAHELAMMVFMTVPMVGWMRVRGHGWQHGAEMAVGMLVPVVVIDLLLLAGAGGAAPWLQHASGPSMLLGMVAAMLLRLGHYTGGHATADASAGHHARAATGHA
jgi:putative intracellular protease/amidase